MEVWSLGLGLALNFWLRRALRSWKFRVRVSFELLAEKGIMELEV